MLLKGPRDWGWSFVSHFASIVSRSTRFRLPLFVGSDLAFALVVPSGASVVRPQCRFAFGVGFFLGIIFVGLRFSIRVRYGIFRFLVLRRFVRFLTAERKPVSSENPNSLP